MEQFLTKTPNPLLSVTKDGIVVYSNKAAEPLMCEWGVKAGGNLPSNIIDLVQRVISQNSPEKLEVKVGNKVYLVVFSPLPQKECVNISGFVITEQREHEEKIQENAEKYRYLVAITRDSDIIERKHAEEAFFQSEQHCRLLYETMLGVVYQDVNGKIISMNPAAKRILGKTSSEFLGSSSVGEEYHTIREDGSKFPGLEHPAMVSLQTGQKVKDVIMGIYNPRKKCYRWINISAVPLFRSGEDKPFQVYTLFEDITERKHAEDALRKSEERLLLAQQVAKIGTFELNIKTGVNIWTPELEAMYGLRPGGFGKTLKDWEQLVYADDRPKAMHLVEKAFQTKEPAEGEWRVIWPDGSVHWLTGRWQVLSDASGKPSRMVGMNIDITERKEAETKLKKTLEYLENLVKERTSELEKAYSTLKESEKGLADAQRIAHIGNWDWNFITDKIYASDETYRILGYNPKEFKPTYDILLNHVHPNDRDYVDDAIKQALKGKPLNIDFRIVSADSVESIVNEQAEIVFDENNNPVQMRGTIQDITERKQAEEERNYLLQNIDEQRAYLQAIIDSLPVGLWIADTTGRLIFTNNVASKIWGGKIPFSKKVDEYNIYKAWWPETGELIAAEDMPLARAIKGDANTQSVVDFERFDGTHGTQLVSSAPIKISDGSIVGGVAIVQDITELKRIENELQITCEELQVQSEDLEAQSEELRIANEELNESKDRFKLLSEANALLLSRNEPETVIQVIAENVMRHLDCDVFFNYIYDDVTGRLHLNACSGISPEAAKEIEWLDKLDEETICGCAAREGYRIVAENLIQNRDNQTRGKQTDLVRSMWIHAYACQPLRIGEKTIGTISFGTKNRNNFTEDELSLISYVADQVSVAIERKQAEDKIRDLANIVESSNDAIITKSLEGIITSWNKGAEQVYGYSAEEVLRKNISLLEPANLKDEIKKLSEKIKQGEKVQHYETLRLKKDGTIINVSVTLSPVFDLSGKLVAISVIARDITKRKKAEEALRESEERFNLAVKAAQEGVWDWNLETDEVWYSSRYKEMLGYSEDEIEHHVNSWLRLLHPDDKERSLKIVDAVMRGERNYELEFRLRHKDGHYLNILSRGYPVRRESDGKIVRIVGTHFDLTDRKKAEKDLLKSKEQYQALFNSISEGFANCKAIYDEHGTLCDLLILDINPAGARISGLEREAQIGKTVREAGPDVEDYWFEAYQKVDETGESIQFENFGSMPGKWFTVRIDRIEKGQFAVIFRDITERKIAEEHLRSSEERYRSFIQNSGGIAFQIDENFNLEFIHGAVKEITGYSEEELFSDISWRQLVVPEDLDIYLEAEKKAVQISDSFQGELEYRIKTKDGKIKWMQEYHQKIPGKNGKAGTYNGILYDITEKKEAKQALAKYETARKKEIHHRIKNNLQIISALLELQAEKLKGKTNLSNSEIQHAFKESQDRVLSMALIHEELYRGGETDKLNFSSYAEKLAENLILTYRVGNKDISLDMDLEENTFFDFDTAIPLGIIINELVSNSFKYAFQGRDKGEIKIRLLRDKNIEYKNKEYAGNTYILSVSDNGVSIPENIDIENLDSLGLQLVTTLVDQIDGELELKRSNGTEFTVKFTVTEKDN